MMYLLAYALGGGVRIADLERIPGVVRDTLELESEIDALSERYRFMRHAVGGARLDYSNAFEMSLKLMETCYVWPSVSLPPISCTAPSPSSSRISRCSRSPRPARRGPPSARRSPKLQGLQAEIVAITDSGNREVDGRATRSSACRAASGRS